MIFNAGQLRRFLVEITPAESHFDDVQALTARARAACAALNTDENPIRFLRSIFLPEDGTFLLLFEADATSGVEEALQRADLAVDWISELRRHQEVAQ
jgi:hypothetical protein